MNKISLYVTTLLLVTTGQAMDHGKGPYGFQAQHLPTAPPPARYSSSASAIAEAELQLARLRAEEEVQQQRLRAEALRQGDVRHRGLATAIIPDPLRTPVELAPVDLAPTRGHHRQRSLSNPEVLAAAAPPAFEHFDTRVQDGSLRLGLDVLDRIEATAALLVTQARDALRERAHVHQELSATSLTPELKRRTGSARVLNVFDSEKARLKRHLDAQVGADADRRAKSAKALNHILAAIVGAEYGLQKLQAAVSVGAERATVKHEALQRSASIRVPTGGARRANGPALDQRERTLLLSPPSSFTEDNDTAYV